MRLQVPCQQKGAVALNAFSMELICKEYQPRRMSKWGLSVYPKVESRLQQLVKNSLW